MNNEHDAGWGRPTGDAGDAAEAAPTAGWEQTGQWPSERSPGQWDSQWEPSAAAGAQTPQTRRGKKTGIIVGAVALVAGAGVAGALILQGVLGSGGGSTTSAEPVVVYSTEVVTADEESPADATETTAAAARAAEPAADVCDPDVVLGDVGVPQWTVVDHCDGEWAMAGAKASDDLGVVRYTNGRWAGYDHCANGRDSVPAHLQRFLHTCDPQGTGPVGPARSSGHSVPSARGTIQASSPACDGRGILIVNSVVEQPGVSTEQQLTDALNAVPGTEYTLPGQCSSLRASLDGAAVYPVYIDYGSDRQALCAGKARYGGNARTLNTVGDFHDPC